MRWLALGWCRDPGRRSSDRRRSVARIGRPRQGHRAGSPFAWNLSRSRRSRSRAVYSRRAVSRCPSRAGSHGPDRTGCSSPASSSSPSWFAPSRSSAAVGSRATWATTTGSISRPPQPSSTASCRIATSCSSTRPGSPCCSRRSRWIAGATDGATGFALARLAFMAIGALNAGLVTLVAGRYGRRAALVERDPLRGVVRREPGGADDHPDRPADDPSPACRPDPPVRSPPRSPSRRGRGRLPRRRDGDPGLGGRAGRGRGRRRSSSAGWASRAIGRGPRSAWSAGLPRRSRRCASRSSSPPRPRSSDTCSSTSWRGRASTSAS